MTKLKGEVKSRIFIVILCFLGAISLILIIGNVLLLVNNRNDQTAAVNTGSNEDDTGENHPEEVEITDESAPSSSYVKASAGVEADE